MKKRKLYYEIEDYLLNGEYSVLLMLGLRKVGKSTILQQLEANLGKNRVKYIDCRHENLTPELYFELFDIPQEYILIDELGYFEDFDIYMGTLLSNIDMSDKKFVLTSSSYGLIKQLAHEKLGGGRAKIFELFPLSFEEYLYFSGKIKNYDEDYEPIDEDLQQFYRLKNVPKGMNLMIDDQYFDDTRFDTEVGWDNQDGTLRDILLTDIQFKSVLDVLAYSLNNQISLKRFKNMRSSIGHREFPKLRLTENIINLADEKLTVSDIGKIISYLYYNGFLFADLVVTSKNVQCPRRICADFGSVQTEAELRTLLRTYILSVISPLLYTRLLVKMENIVQQLCEEQGLYGELYELAMKSEYVCLKGYSRCHCAFKYKEDDIEVDMVDFCSAKGHGCDFAMKLSITHKKNSEHHLLDIYKNSNIRRILTDKQGVWERDGEIIRIGYPKALLMLSNNRDYSEFLDF